MTNDEVVLTSFTVSTPTTNGLMIPGMVAKQLLIPNKILAYRGAMSRWLIGKPVQAKPPRPTANVNPTMAKSLFFVYPTRTRNEACEKNPTQQQQKKVRTNRMSPGFYMRA